MPTDKVAGHKSKDNMCVTIGHFELIIMPKQLGKGKNISRRGQEKYTVKYSAP